MRWLLICMALMVAVSPCVLRAQTTQPGAVQQLQTLVTELRRIVPSQYSVDLTPSDLPHRGPTTDVPAIIVETKSPNLVQYAIANAAEGAEESPTNEHVSVIWRMRPYVSPEQFVAIAADNQRREARRLDFVTKLKTAGIAWGFMGPDPIPPHAFHPASDAQTQMVREYQLLWLETEPQPLPTHHSTSISFELTRDVITAIVDQRQADAFDEMMRKVQTILIPYEAKR